MSTQTFAFILLSQEPPEIVELCEYQLEFNRSSEIDRVFSQKKIVSWLFEFFNVYSVMGAWDESKTKYNWNRYSHSWVIIGLTNTVCDILLYVQYRYSLRFMWISTRVKLIVFFSKISSWLFEFCNVYSVIGVWDESKNRNINNIDTAVLEL